MGVPTTREEIEVLLDQKPDLWEYLLWAAVLRVELTKHEPAYRDHLLRHAPPAGRPLDWEATFALIDQAIIDLEALATDLLGTVDPDVQQRAFGPPGEPGDAELIEHMARRTIDNYRALIDLGKIVRAARVLPEARTAVGLAADFTRQPVEDIRNFVSEAVAAVDGMADLVAKEPDGHDPIEINLDLVITADHDVVARYAAEVARLGARSG